MQFICKLCNFQRLDSTQRKSSIHELKVSTQISIPASFTVKVKTGKMEKTDRDPDYFIDQDREIDFCEM